MMLERGDVIERPGPWPTQHRGIFAGWDGYGRGWVIHNPKGGCVKYDLLEDFAERQQVKRIEQRTRTAYERNLIVARAHSQLNKPYDILNFNCEHLVTYALGGVSSSPQLQAATVGLALVVGFGMLFGR
jgi:hypothetical protein